MLVLQAFTLCDRVLDNHPTIAGVHGRLFSASSMLITKSETLLWEDIITVNGI